MSKTIILVEDEMHKLRPILTYIQSLLFYAVETEEGNAPQNNDTTIVLLYVYWGRFFGCQAMPSEAEREFLDYKLALESREQNLKKNGHSIPKLNYRFDSVTMRSENYPNNSTECADLILNRISEIHGENQPYAVLIDVILNRSLDTRIVLNDDKSIKVLSELLYTSLSSKCIPYTTYDDGGAVFRQKWCNRVERVQKLYDRAELEGNDINIKSLKEFYTMLNIGGADDE
ncbi:MAG: hypothetical protein IJ079_08320 [Lachnospiraceae bacterium]|nr:hypothetical protein [Lachnospiraceae bacterium]